MLNVYFRCTLSQLVYNQPGIQQIFEKRIAQLLQICRKAPFTHLWYIMANVYWFEFLITCTTQQITVMHLKVNYVSLHYQGSTKFNRRPNKQ